MTHSELERDIRSYWWERLTPMDSAPVYLGIEHASWQSPEEFDVKPPVAVWVYRDESGRWVAQRVMMQKARVVTLAHGENARWLPMAPAGTPVPFEQWAETVRRRKAKGALVDEEGEG